MMQYFIGKGTFNGVTKRLAYSIATLLSFLMCATFAQAEQTSDAEPEGLFGCNKNMIYFCPNDPNGSATILPIERRTYGPFIKTCLPDNSRPGTSVINHILGNYGCTLPAKCISSLPSRVDGCSVPKVLSIPRALIQDQFGAACVGHDICYNNPGMGKSHCDKMFLNNMLEICVQAYTKGSPLWATCNANAAEVYGAVAAAAGSAYSEDQQWGQANCQ